MNTVKIEQTKEGFKLDCSLNEIPLDIVEQIVNATTSMVRDQVLKELADKIPDESQKYIAFLQHYIKKLKRLNLFWYALALVFIGLYILK